MSTELVIKNATIVGRREVRARGFLRARGGMITDIGTGAVACRSAIDFMGDYLVPGIVDLHTDNLERNVAPRTAVRWPMLSALLIHDTQLIGAGITTALDAIAIGESRNDKPSRDIRREMVDDALAMLETSRRKSLLRADHFVHLRLDVSNERILQLFEKYAIAPGARLVSLVDRRPLAPQNGETGSTGERERRRAARMALAQRAAALSLTTASHDDRTADEIALAAAIGVRIAEFPETETAAGEARVRGMAVAMGAPNVVRGGSQHAGHASAIGLERVGCLDLLCSDYVPFSLMHAVFVLHKGHGVDLASAMRMVSAVPAELAGFNDRGELVTGKRADMIRVFLLDAQPVVRAVWRHGERVA